MNNTIKVVLTEDNTTIREGLALLINATDGMACIATFSNCEDMLPTIGKNKPDIFLHPRAWCKESPGFATSAGCRGIRAPLPTTGHGLA